MLNQISLKAKLGMGLALISFLTATPAQALNFISNGDFELGNDGSFSSDSTFVTSITNNDQYAINTSPTNVRALWADFGDHTTGFGLMFLSSTETDNAWKQTTNVIAGQEYDFSGWFTIANAGTQGDLPISFAVDGSIINTLNLAGTIPGVWTELTASYIPAVSGTIELQLTNTGIPVLGGRDWAADDLSFDGPVAVPFEVSPTWGFLIVLGISVLRRKVTKSQD